MDTASLDDLRLDYDLYPRKATDVSNVAAIEDALKLGAEIPAIVAWKDNGAVVDGVHRVRAWKLAFGNKKPIPVEWREYESEADAFEDALRLNAHHGLRLGKGDHARIIRRGAELGLKDVRISALIKVPVVTLQKRVQQAEDGAKGARALGKAAADRGYISPAQGTSVADVEVSEAFAQQVKTHNKELRDVVAEIARRLELGDEIGPGNLPFVMGKIKQARDSGTPSNLRAPLIDAAILFIAWASRTPSPMSFDEDEDAA